VQTEPMLKMFSKVQNSLHQISCWNSIDYAVFTIQLYTIFDRQQLQCKTQNSTHHNAIQAQVTSLSWIKTDHTCKLNQYLTQLLS